jgi:hypothetical protein
MRSTEDLTFALAEIILDGVAMSEATLEHDWEEARFRCQLIATKTADAGHMGAGLAAVLVLDHLGASGTKPRDGYGDAMNRLSAEIDALQYAG